MADTNTSIPQEFVSTKELEAAISLNRLMREGKLGAFPIEDTPEARAEIKFAAKGAADFLTLSEGYFTRRVGVNTSSKFASAGKKGLEQLADTERFCQLINMLRLTKPREGEPREGLFPLAELSATLEAETGAQLYIAGGFVGRWVRGRMGRTADRAWNSDADLFIVMPGSNEASEASEEELRTVVARAIELVGQWARSARKATIVSRTARATTFVEDPMAEAYRNRYPYAREIQVVHRVYSSVGQLLADFDHGGCAFASDGAGNFFESPLGRLARTRGVIVLDPSAFRRSTPARLIKYIKRGLSLVLPGAGSGESLTRRLALMITAAKEGFAAITPHIGVYRLKVVRDEGQAGALVLADTFKETHPLFWDSVSNSDEFPKYYSDNDYYGGKGYDHGNIHRMRKTLARELAVQITSDSGWTPIGSQYFDMPSAQDFSAYCRALAEGKNIPLRAIQAGNEKILAALKSKLEYSAELLEFRPTMKLLGAKLPQNVKYIRDKTMKHARRYLNLHRNGPEFLVGQGILSETEPSDELTASAYTCTGFPYGYEPSSLEL